LSSPLHIPPLHPNSTKKIPCMKGHGPLVLKKEIKDACPKKVCHMLTRHVKKMRGHIKVP